MKTEVRVDKWLWAMRVFKTRTVSSDSCKKGRVMLRIGGEGPEVIAKPSRMIHVGDVVMVRKPPITYSFKVKALTENRLGAKLVPEYMENVTTRDQLDMLDVVKISGFIDRRKGLGRPTKREARELNRFTSDIYSDVDSYEEPDDMALPSGPGDIWNLDFDEDDFI
jgi:heat shock protein 15